jgi:hypothetical protein
LVGPRKKSVLFSKSSYWRGERGLEGEKWGDGRGAWGDKGGGEEGEGGKENEKQRTQRSHFSRRLAKFTKEYLDKAKYLTLGGQLKKVDRI